MFSDFCGFCNMSLKRYQNRLFFIEMFMELCRNSGKSQTSYGILLELRDIIPENWYLPSVHENIHPKNKSVTLTTRKKLRVNQTKVRRSQRRRNAVTAAKARPRARVNAGPSQCSPVTNDERVAVPGEEKCGVTASTQDGEREK